MSLIKSNSAIIAFDNSIASLQNQFSFLDFVQSFSININTNRINEKYLGSSLSNKAQFVQPEIDFEISYIQKNNFYNEKLFGFEIILNANNYTSIASKLTSSFYNKNAFVLFEDVLYSDIAYELFNNNFNTKMISLSLGNLYIKNYSFSYSIGTPALVNVGFSSSDLKISNLTYSSSVYKIQNWDDTEITLNKDISIPFIQDTREYIDKNIVYQMRNFSFSNNFQSTSTPGPAIDNFLNGLIQSLDFSIDFSRNNFYFFNKKNIPDDRKIILPIKAQFNISGISNFFEYGNLKNLFNSDQKFSCVISIGDSTDANFDYYQIFLDDISIDSFDYSLEINDMLKYSIKCSVDINSEKGFRILELNSKKIIYLIDSNSDFIQSSEGYFLGARL